MDERRQQALALHRAGQLMEAAALYGELLEQEPHDAELLGLMGLAQHQLGREDDAISHWRRSLDAKASARARLRIIANILAAAKPKGAPAIAAFIAGLEIPAWPEATAASPADNHMIITLARNLLTHGRKDAAAALLDSTLAGRSDDKDHVKAAAAILIDAGHAGKAADLLRPLTAASDADGGLLATHAAAAHRLGHEEESQQLIRRAVEAVPVLLTAKQPGQILLVGVISQPPPVFNFTAGTLPLHFNNNTPASMAFTHNDRYRFLSVFPEARQAMQALSALPRPDVYFNNWVNAELLSTPRTLDRIASFADGLGVPVINHPRHAAQTTRQQNAERLAGIQGLVLPKIIRFANDPSRADAAVRAIGEMIGFPVIIRGPYAQKGRSAVRLGTPSELARHLAAQPSLQLYAIQYVDNPVVKGLYRKIRAAVIGDEVFISHVHLSPDWKVHREPDKKKIAAFDPDGLGVAQARHMTANPEEALGRPAMAALHEIRRRTPLDFYGIDFDLTKDGRVLFFEANAAMNLMLTDSPGRERVRGAMREAVRRLFESRAGLRA
jgi:Flp pilus assembly protein TadD/glutathione synthase/RimK-type ligase-like ATP-grasp enzyme